MGLFGDILDVAFTPVRLTGRAVRTTVDVAASVVDGDFEDAFDEVIDSPLNATDAVLEEVDRMLEKV